MSHHAHRAHLWRWPFRLYRWRIPLLAAPALLLSGCGGSAASAVPTPTPPAQSIPAPTVTAGLQPRPLPPLGLRPADVPPVVATVNGIPVPTWLYLSQVNFNLAMAESSPSPRGPGTPVTSAQRLAIEQQSLAAVIDETLLVAYGEAHGWAPSRRQAAAEYQRVVQRRGGPTASLRQVASEYLTVAQDQIVARDHLVTQQVLDHFIASLHQPVAAASFRMIVTPSRDAAARARDLLIQSDSWVDVAARFSIDPVGRRAGGEQSILTRAAAADPRLLDAVFQLAPNRVSAPLRIRQGWAIVEVLRYLPSSDLYRADLLRYKQWVASLRPKAQVTTYLSLPRGQQ